MDVLLNDDENLIVDSAREFLTGECSTKLVREMEADALGYSRELWGQGRGTRLAGDVHAGEGRRIEYAPGLSGAGAA